MDFKVEIECAKCRCSFELRPHDFKDSDSMECPNCGQAVPGAVYVDLKTGVVALGRIPEYVNEESTNPLSEHLFTMRIKSFGNLHDLFDRGEN